MEKFLYTYLMKKYTTKSIVIEWANSILESIKNQQNEDINIAIFSKILNNECDEYFV